jgi:hypothetical protein
MTGVLQQSMSATLDGADAARLAPSMALYAPLPLAAERW